ncbi:SDR family NAD(P)-dependent oxidoreductase [Vallicoccus soli]|uniref:SDR family NAD(P)-dependent oxidoreductase n=1 Tax=Vallicoccus soli TaxID=2339232 RepID=A0A3A3ZKF7_9ACTN|nr:SDR family NAD(P)-dependent oxidoreductase [Vallicoccus soli]RJK96320.1 SDR family NAD(P)-dependent oxidoreductase [Vallicoccus soli]
MQITDRTAALVTGGASGLGLATARALRAAGAQVVVLDLPGAPGREAAEAEGLVFAGADVTDEEGVAAAVRTAEALGDLRVAVNCAGVATPGKLLGRHGVLALEEFRRVVEVNLVGTLNVTRLAAEAMARAEPVDGERGVVVMTASVAAFDGQVGQVAYSASKGGVAAMTLPLARELARSLVRVVTVAPGVFRTPMVAGLPQPAQDSLGQQVPHPARLGEPPEYAALVEHLVRNAYLNGEVVRLDGAIRMAPR